MSEPIVSIQGVSKQFGAARAVDDITLDVTRNEFLALLGPSGCGKTTLLRIIAGLEVPTAGQIYIDGHDMAAVPPNRRPVNMVFQSYAVFPHMNVADNVAYGLKVAGGSAGDIRALVSDALQMVQLDGYEKRKPDQLSGGQRQRVALARALIKRPKVLLLDEPLSALDARLREQMQSELTQLQRAVGITFIIVTHDQNEALSMADRVAVMNHGKIAQLAQPGQLYNQPASRFVAEFIGRINLLDGQIAGAQDDDLIVELREVGPVRLPYAGAAHNGMAVGVRPEHVRLTSVQPRTGLIGLRGTIAGRTFYGDSSQFHLITAGEQRIMSTLRNENLQSGKVPQYGDTVWASWSPEDCMLLNEDSSRA